MLSNLCNGSSKGHNQFRLFVSPKSTIKYLKGATIKGKKLLPIGNPVKGGHSKIEKTKVLKASGSLVQVEKIAECKGIQEYFALH